MSYGFVQERLAAFAKRGGTRTVAFYDYDSGISHHIDGGRLMPAASVIKVGLVAALHRLAARGEIDIDATEEIAQLPDSIYPSVLGAFASSERLSLRTIGALALITSDNRAAAFLHQLLGREEVLSTLRDLGAPNSRYAASFGDADLGESNRRNQLTAVEALAVFAAIRADPIYSGLVNALRNNIRSSRIPLYLHEETLVIHKTGTLEGVANDVGLIYGERSQLGFAFFCDGQVDRVAVERDIGECVADICEAHGQSVNHDPR